MGRSGFFTTNIVENKYDSVNNLSTQKKSLQADLALKGINKFGIFKGSSGYFLYLDLNKNSVDLSSEVIPTIIDHKILLETLGKVAPAFLELQCTKMDEIFFTQGYTDEDDQKFQRTATFMRVKPGFELSYRTAHTNIWPSILEGIQRTKIRNYSIFMNDTDLYSYFEVKDLKYAMTVLAADKENQRWQLEMSPMMDIGSGMKDGSSAYMQGKIFVITEQEK